MSQLNTASINHVESFRTIETLSDANHATREIVTTAWTESVQEFEGFMLRNTAIFGPDSTSSYQNKVDLNKINNSNPYGSLRAAVKPRKKANTWNKIKSYGDIKFQDTQLDSITLEINKPLKTTIETIAMMDRGGWLYSDIESTLAQTSLNAIITDINYDLYSVFGDAAKYAVQSENGKAARWGTASEIATTFTADLIADIQSYKALPNDRYVYGFKPEELAIVMSPDGQGKLLAEKLVIYDGQFMGYEGKFFTGLPYEFTFNGVPLFVSEFLNEPGYEDTNDGQKDYIITTRGRFGALLFDIALFGGRAEEVDFSAGTLGVYAWALWGRKIAPVFEQYVTVKYSASETLEAPYGDSNIVQSGVTARAADSISVQTIPSGTGGGNIKFSISELDDDSDFTPFSTEIAFVDGVKLEYTFTGLDSRTPYRITIENLDGTASEVATSGRSLEVFFNAETV